MVNPRIGRKRPGRNGFKLTRGADRIPATDAGANQTLAIIVSANYNSTEHRAKIGAIAPPFLAKKVCHHV